MDKFTEENLKITLKKYKDKKNEKEQILKEIEEKIKQIKDYEDFNVDTIIGGIFGGFFLILGSVWAFGCCEIFNVMDMSSVVDMPSFIISRIIFVMFILIDAYLFYGGVHLLNIVRLDFKEMKKIEIDLNLKELKDMRKEKDVLLEEKSVFEKERDNIQNIIDEIKTILGYFEFCELINDSSSKEIDNEYEIMLNNREKYEQLFNEFLDSKIDYANIHLSYNPNDVESKKLLKRNNNI